eukprot:GFYU01043180.1.p1 GENE.GFYU01043180.1~~GFYU01043180.1.p1  ORF type:complete len:292 (-),score=68.28 GFYU01043180.1:88-963(-)
MDLLENPFTTDTVEGIIQEVFTKGYAVKDNVFSPQLFATVLTEVERFIADDTVTFSQGLNSEGVVDHNVRTDLTTDAQPFTDRDKYPALSCVCRLLQWRGTHMLNQGMTSRLWEGAGGLYKREERRLQLYAREKPQFAVYEGKESFYTAHLDNMRYVHGHGDNRRRVTLVYYLNDVWHEDNGGCLRLYHRHINNHRHSYLSDELHLPPATGSVTVNDTAGQEDLHVDVAPLGNRMVVFWSDMLYHSVLPTRGGYHRKALGIWLSERRETDTVEEKMAQHIADVYCGLDNNT